MDAGARALEPRSCRAARAAASRRMSGGVQASGAYSADEMMTVTAARQLRNGAVCFVGIGLPSAACNLARRTHAPELVLIYESGTVGARPRVLPLSIGDGELADTADCVVSLPEVFAHYLQRGRVDVGFLSAAQIDRHGNLNTTVIGSYARPAVRLPGSGGAPEIAAHAREVLVIMKQSPRSFVPRLDFLTSCGYLGSSGLPDELRVPRRRRRARPRGLSGTRPAGRDHRFRHPAPSPRDRGAAAVRHLSRRYGGRRARRHRLAAGRGARSAGSAGAAAGGSRHS